MKWKRAADYERDMSVLPLHLNNKEHTAVPTDWFLVFLSLVFLMNAVHHIVLCACATVEKGPRPHIMPRCLHEGN